MSLSASIGRMIDRKLVIALAMTASTKKIHGAIVLALASAPTSAFAQKVAFNVPEQAAAAGIPEFARQARIQIVSPSGIDAMRTGPVKGRFTLEEGLRKLLRGTNLHVVLRSPTFISLGEQPVVKRRISAQKAPPRPKPNTEPIVSERPEEADIVVTGTIQPQRRIDSGLAITTMSLDRIHEIAPNNTADLLKVVPGIWAETTGGVTGANVFVRGFPTNGDAPFLTVQLDGAPIFPPTELSFNENTTLFRVDDMVERVEVLRGGPSPIFSNGQPGAIMNFIQRTGTPDLAGGIRLSTSDYGTRRLDGYVTGPLALDTVFAIGGFYRSSDGLRNTQFPADEGGQITGNMTHRFGDGVITAYVRYTRDRNAFYTGVPLLADGEGNVTALPGFDPLRDTLIGRDTEHLSIETGPGTLRPVNLQDGRGLKLILAGTSLEWAPGPNIKVTNRVNVTSGNVDTIGLFTGPLPETLGQYISDTVGRANGDPRVVTAAGVATSGLAVLSGTTTPLGPDRYVLTAGLWSIREKIFSVTDELRVSTAIGDSHKLTGGVFLSHYRSNDARALGNNLLLLAEPNARRLDLTLNNGVQATREGFVSATTNQIVSQSAANNVAAFLSDEWSISSRTIFNAGLRFEHQDLTGSVRNVAANTDFDDNPMTLYDNNGALLLSSTTPLSEKADRLSLSAGLVHKLVPDRVTLHARFNHGSNLPSFEKLRLGTARGQSAEIFEAGADLVAGPVRASINGFVNRFRGLQFSRLLEQPDGTIGTIVLLGGAHAAGLELETDVRPTKRWKVEFRSTFEDSRYRGFGDNAGNRVVRQPRMQFATSPSYTVPLGRAEVKLHATYSYVGVRYSDVENLQRLPGYSTIDAGIHAELPSGFYTDVVAQNVTNSFGLTEGNTRVLGAVLTSGPIIARPLFGRNISISLGYRF